MAKILLIDDDPHWQQMLALTLEIQGHLVLKAGNGKKAMMRLGEEAIDLIICDVEMPCMDGLIFARLVREDPRASQIPLMFLTSHNEPAERLKGLNLGADDYLSKTANVEELALRIHNVTARCAKTRTAYGNRSQRLLDHLPMAAVIVDKAGNLQRRNSLFECSKGGVQVIRNTLVGLTASSTKQVRDAIDGASRGLACGPIPLDRKVQLPVFLSAAPVDDEDGQGDVLVTITDPELDHKIGHEIQKIFKFTPQEARLATLLMQGATLAGASTLMGVCRTTAVSHLKRLFDKVDVRRQSDLIRRLMGVHVQLGSRAVTAS